MSRIPDSFIDALLARTDIVEVIDSRVKLRRAGREYTACCPFHDERSASFTVSPTKQFYHCFGCGAHGTAIKFVMEYDRLEFVDAVEELAKRVGMEVPHDERAQRGPQDDFAPLYAATRTASDWFRQQLASAAAAKVYLQKRGVDAATQAKFELGYAPGGWDALLSALGKDEASRRVLDKVGLSSKNDAGKVYDKFRERLMFPIHDRRGRVIAFGGRVMGADDGPKYLNSPETPLFRKGRELYGLWQVKQAHARIPRLIVVEGYMDVVALFQYGVHEAVATLGTATTSDHAELLFRNASDVYFCFDGDRAGRAAAWKALEAALPRMRDGRQAFFLFLPDGEDPDSLIRKEGAEGFDVRLKSAMPLSSFFFSELSRDIQLDALDGRARLAERARPLLQTVPDGAFRDLIWLRLNELTGLQQSAPREPRNDARHAAVRGSHSTRRSMVRIAIELLMQRPALAQRITPPYVFEHLDQPGVALLIALLNHCQPRPELSTGALLEAWRDSPDLAALTKLATSESLTPEEGLEADFDGALRGLELAALEQRERALQARVREVGLAGLSHDEKEELRLLPQLKQVRKTRA
ncbi:MAG: DNA primase [Alphaproteobacteria bacterium ADurb.BinA280]|jgi:DNA primase|nr:DNA primase [Xanthomonadales bacterium]MCC6503954.1 DNA primase [Aquimonas sp.]OPZ13456.1 MAG: DNA primase [Alphaproteobacteria bacterium ADurb.BinA280]